jgi:hypothetical protein
MHIKAACRTFMKLTPGTGMRPGAVVEKDWLRQSSDTWLSDLSKVLFKSAFDVYLLSSLQKEKYLIQICIKCVISIFSEA